MNKDYNDKIVFNYNDKLLCKCGNERELLGLAWGELVYGIMCRRCLEKIARKPNGYTLYGPS